MLLISPQKLFSFSRYLTFCFDFFGRVAKRLDQKDKVNFKIYDVTAWLTNNCNTHVAHISRSKRNQTIKFGQLIDYIMRINFIGKLYTKFGGETSPRLFSEKLKFRISLGQ